MERGRPRLTQTGISPARAVRAAPVIVEESAALDIGIRAGLHTTEFEIADGKLAGSPRRAAPSTCEDWDSSAFGGSIETAKGRSL